VQMPFAVPDDLIATAIRDVHSTAPRLLPADPGFQVCANNVEVATEWISSVVNAAFIPSREEVVATSKPASGVRPVALWDIPSRVLYRALTNKIAQALPPLDRSAELWNAFKRSPLATDCRYIVTTDIASCYQYIDHALLAEELHVRGGDHQSIEAVVRLLAEVGGRGYGLPQQSWSSDVLAEAILDKIERALIRRGVQVNRYNDDFRFACSSWSKAIEAIELFADTARQHGLAMNDQKTFAWKRGTYERSLDEMVEQREAITKEVEFGEWTEADYEQAMSRLFTPTAVQVKGAVKVLHLWAVGARRTTHLRQPSARRRALAELLPEALLTLANGDDPGGEEIKDALQVLRFSRHRTPQLAAYLAAETVSGVVTEPFGELLQRGAYLNNWQTWWMLTSVASNPGFKTGPGSRVRTGWLRAAQDAESPGGIVSANAALISSRLGEASLDDLMRMYDRASAIVRPTVVAAIARAKPPKNIRRSIERESLLHQLIWEREPKGG
jgi:RNA-directed DNA polymerase